MLFSEVLERVPGKFQLSTDSFKVFRDFMKGMPERVDCGTELKHFGPSVDASSVRKVTKLVGCTRTLRKGRPDMDRVTTTHQERLHLTFRQQMRRFGRRTLGYSKKIEFHEATVNTFIFIFNWCRRSQSVAIKGKTSAMAAGLAEKPLSLNDLVRITDAYTKARTDAEFERLFAEKYNLHK